ncbi:N-acetyltransferase [Bacillus sp. HMF5848]|uniref:GNAT family N-acetyltransferase n=1 Tax=Bacillus sp. HMF5848 TaxID=2495421 RepID=UPI000F769D74|nr:GNAT family protein [Bacillus sp. HMF5848]RSK26407.1 N-acetyltransferase [Bacillus sp. HMF5848]
MNVVIREAKLIDAPQIIEHVQTVLTESTFMLMTPDEFSLTVKEEEKFLQKSKEDRNLALVAEADGKIVGFMTFRRSTRQRMKHHGTFGVSIQEAFCNFGIGRQMMAHLLSWAEADPDIEKICLEVFSHNERAIHLYKKLGFVEEGRRLQHVKFEDGTYVDEIEMYKFVK